MRTIPFTEEHKLKEQKRIDFINDEIHDLFGIHLVTCPQCGIIHSFKHDDYIKRHTCNCGLKFNQTEGPDLFY